MSARDEAKAAGSKFYVGSKPCKHGHALLRYTSTGACVECIKVGAKARPQELKNANLRKWRAANPDKRDASQAAWIAKNKDHLKAYESKRHAQNRDANIERMRDWYARNADKVCESRRLNPGPSRAAGRNRRARLRNAEGTHCAEDIIKLMCLQRGCCANCTTSLEDGYHVDHKQPLALGGSNDPGNLELLCPPCNRSKGAKDPYVFARLNGRLL